MTKFEQLEDYINQANEILESNDTAKAERYCQRVIAVIRLHSTTQNPLKYKENR